MSTGHVISVGTHILISKLYSLVANQLLLKWRIVETRKQFGISYFDVRIYLKDYHAISILGLNCRFSGIILHVPFYWLCYLKIIVIFLGLTSNLVLCMLKNVLMAYVAALLGMILQSLQSCSYFSPFRIFWYLKVNRDECCWIVKYANRSRLYSLFYSTQWNNIVIIIIFSLVDIF